MMRGYNGPLAESEKRDRKMPQKGGYKEHISCWSLAAHYNLVAQDAVSAAVLSVIVKGLQDSADVYLFRPMG